MEAFSLEGVRRSEEQDRTCVPEGPVHFSWSICTQVPLVRVPDLGVTCDRRPNRTESKEMQLDGYSYQSKCKHIGYRWMRSPPLGVLLLLS